MTEREIALIKSAQQGDTKAFGELAAAYDQKVMNLALSLVGSVDDARDIYQEVFTKVFKSLKNYQFKSAFYTWLYRIVVNTCLTYRKSRSRRQEMTPVSVEGNPETLATIAEDKAYESDADLMRSEREYQVRCAIDTLPPRQKAVVILRHYHDKKIREIAEIMELNEGTVKGYLFRALNTLKSRLEPYYL